MSAPSDPFPKLPHTAPFLLLDRILDVDERRGVFVKLVAAADPLVAPDGTLPAAFLVEALAQGGGALLNALVAKKILVRLGGNTEDRAVDILQGIRVLQAWQ